MESLIPVAVVVLLLIINALFVASEFAIVGAPRATVERRAIEGNRAARLVHRVLDNPRRQDRYIATAQLGITFASLGLGAYGEHALAHWLEGQLSTLGAARWIAAHTLASVSAVSALTFMHIVVGEMIPKSLALQQPERTAYVVSPPLVAIQTLLLPLIVVFNGGGNLVLRLLGVNRSSGGHDRFHTPEELEIIVEESLRGGAIGPESGFLLRELFDFADLTAGDVMVPRVRLDGIEVGTAPEALRTLVRERPHTRYPVYRENLDNVIGVVHLGDILRVLERGTPIRADDAHTAPFVPESAHLEAVARMMRATPAQMIFVLDEHGGTAGAVSPDDLSQEILGRVEPGADETLLRDSGGIWHVDGTIRLDELSEALGRVVAFEEIDTVSGLVLALLEREPRVGDVVTIVGLRIRVTRIIGHGVGRVSITVGALPDGEPS